MTASKPLHLVPKLRFPEFQSRRGWVYTMLGEVLKKHGRKSDGISEVHSVSLEKGIVPQVEHLGRSFAAKDTSHYSLVQQFDVVYTRSPLSAFPLGIVKQHKGPANTIVSPLYGVFAPRNQYLGHLVEAYFDSPSRNIQFLDPLAQKGAKNTIQLSDERFLTGALYLPHDEVEQQKIADCLGSLDDLISAESRKLEALRQHKQGLMQQLFPQPDEAVPKLRFPEFQSRRGWVYTMLGEVLKKHGRKSDGISEVHSVSLEKGIVPQVEHLGRSFAAKDTSHYSLVQQFDVVYTRSPLSAFPLGIVKQHKGPANTIVSPLYGVFAPRNQYLGHLVEAYFDSPSRNIQFLDPLAQKGAKNTIQLSDERFLTGALYLPHDEVEQQKIADCLGSLDDLISAESRKLEALRQHKQGLMQQLFPHLEIK